LSLVMRSGHILIDILASDCIPVAGFFYKPMNRRKLSP
jgi:hypothetical protein